MGTPTRLKNGVQIEDVGHPLQNWTFPNPAYAYYYFQDFTNYDSSHWYIQQSGVGSSIGLLPLAGSAALGSAGQFAVLGAAGITNTGNTVITGSIGSFPSASIVGFPPGTVSGQIHRANSVAAQALIDATATFNAYNVIASTATIATDLGGQTLTSTGVGATNVYTTAAGTMTLASAGAATLTLSGDATSIFILRTATTLITGAGGIPTITLAGGAVAKNVFWIVGSSATINTAFAGIFNGTILAQQSISNTLGGTVNGTLVALVGSVTFAAATTAIAALGSTTLIAGGKVGGWLGMVSGSAGYTSIQGANPATAFAVAPVGGSYGQTWFDTAVTLDATVANPDYLIGLTAGSATTLTSVTDGVYFTKATGATVWSIVLKSAATGNTTTIALPASTLPVNSATVGLAFYFDGRPLPNLLVYFNSVLVGRIGDGGNLGTGTNADLINLPGPTILLAPTFLMVFHTGASTLAIDHVLSSTEITRNT
jgi:hypothetical protein